MALLNDHELVDRVNGAGGGQSPMVRNFPAKDESEFKKHPYNKLSPVQPCSIDLHIGTIYLPGDADRTADPRIQYDLPPGHSAIVSTHETLNMPADVGAAAFPLGGRGQRGILMMNPGHIDPGYEGTLWFSLINLSREDYRLSQGDRIATVLFWKTSAPPNAAWKARYGNDVPSEPPDHAAKTIAGDALMLESRAEKKAEEVVERATKDIRNEIYEERKKLNIWGALWGAVIPAVVSIIVLFLNSQFGAVRTLESDSTAAKAKMQTFDTEMAAQKVYLEGKSSQLSAVTERNDRKLADQDQRISDLAKRLDTQRDELAKLQAELSKAPPSQQK